MMMADMIRIMYNGVELPITKVKRLRKKRVAFGLRTLVRNPILNAWSRVRSERDFSAERSNLDFLDRIETTPI
jgi:aryl carrier-like protein